MIRIAKFANGKNMQLIQSGPGGIVVEAFTGLFTVFISAKVIVLYKFSLNSGPLYAILREKANFTDRHVHVFSIFVNKLSDCTVFDERKRQNSEEKGKNTKQSFAVHVLPLCAIDEAGKINRLPK